MTLDLLAWICFGIAALSLLHATLNALSFRAPTRAARPDLLTPLAVLVPARNEAGNIEHCLATILSNDHPNLEVIILDDNSEDGTGEIVDQIAAQDQRVRKINGEPLPDGWNGKQFACWQLVKAARADTLVFLDADVRLAASALSSAHAQLTTSRVSLLSGFPRQLTNTWMEKALIPLIQFVLLGYLPFIMMRKTTVPGFSAGCGQCFITSRTAYEKSGGHQAIRHSAHDGVLLPRVYRAAGYNTEVADFSELASVRMYQNAAEVWRGLMKNATEGIGAKPSIVPMSLLLLGGHVAPWFLLAADAPTAKIALAGIVASLATRLVTTLPYKLSLKGAFLHPVGVLLLVVIQWWAWVEKLSGKKTSWKGRPV